jgi:aminomethyltransferase
MVDFAGWSMPIQYKDSIMESTQWCRDNASLFDVSHMCGVSFKGKDAIKFMHTIVVGDISAMADGTGGYSLITNEKGGIVDDTVVTRVTEDNIYIVVNAGCAEKDLAHFNKYLAPFKVSLPGLAPRPMPSSPVM